MSPIPDVDSLVSDKSVFHDFIYTPLSEAIEILQSRRQNPELISQLNSLIDVPSQFAMPRATLLRYVVTPNYEIIRFLHITHENEQLTPLLCEYPRDKFVPSNLSKRLLGKLTFFKGRNRDGTMNAERLEIIDMADATNKPISSLVTHWGQPLPEFHHELFRQLCPSLSHTEIFDISDWYTQNGPRAKEYYVPLLTLFVAHGVLFENFVLQDKEEGPFIKEVFLPAFLEVYRRTGQKPLIVAFQPTDVEGDKFWLSYPPDAQAFVEHKMAVTV